MQVQKDTVVQFLYTIKDVEGNELESNFGLDPIRYLHGYKNMMTGVEKSLDSMKKGGEIQVELEASETYGPLNPNSEQRIPLKHLAANNDNKSWEAGMVVLINTELGQRQVTIIKVGKFMATVDTNHPYAGKTLQFFLKVVDVRIATELEIENALTNGFDVNEYEG